MKAIRNILAYLLFFVWMYTIISRGGVSEWGLAKQILFAGFGGFVFATIMGNFWEYCQSVMLVTRFDANDVYRNIAGAIIGGYFAVINPNIEAINVYGFYASFVPIVASIVWGVVIMIKRKDI